MAYVAKPGDTASVIAQILTGNASNWPSLKSVGWHGDPEKVAPGSVWYLDTEVAGPPARRNEPGMGR